MKLVHHLPVAALIIASIQGCSVEAPTDEREATQTLSIAPGNVDSQLEGFYQSWKNTYVTSSGAGGFRRVQRTENQNDTVSEGIGYGMLAAAYFDDQALLDDLWSYAKSHWNGNGLMHWRVNSNNQVIGSNAATDADEDMALALIVADKKWGGSYENEAKSLIGKMLSHMVEGGSDVLKPGDVWGGSSVTNPSYFAPGYFHVFADYTGETRWDRVADKCYEILAAIDAKNGSSGLVPDWTDVNGNPASGMGYDYLYDASRMPWRLSHDAQWFNDPRAVDGLNEMNGFWASQGVNNIVDGYSITGQVRGQYKNAAFTTMAASGAVVSNNSNFRSQMWSAGVAAWNDNYYTASLHLLGLLAASGNMVNPLTIGGNSATCSDGVQNQGEAGVDCGGPCTPCTTGSATPIPARIEAEDFSDFYDTTSGHSGDCGSGPVDQQVTSDPSGGTCNVGWTAAGEWLDYSIEVNQSGDYDMNLRLAASSGGRLVSVLIDGSPVGQVTSPGNGWQSWSDRTIDDVPLTAGTHTLRVRFDSGATNFNYIDVLESSGPTATCNDGIQNQNETGVDCGGVCPACSTPETCNDGIQNQNESDIDCGGVCSACSLGESCSGTSDCASGSCSGGVCNTPSGGGDLNATVAVGNNWGAGYCANVTVNNGGAPVSGWTVTLNLNGGSLGNMWNATPTASGSTVEAINVAHNGSIPSGGSQSFGFCASGSSPATVVSVD